MYLLRVADKIRSNSVTKGHRHFFICWKDKILFIRNLIFVYIRVYHLTFLFSFFFFFETRYHGIYLTLAAKMRGSVSSYFFFFFNLCKNNNSVQQDTLHTVS